MLIYESVSKHLTGARTFGPLTLRVPPGHVIGLCGPHGCGKTTALRIALGVMRPEAGIVLVGGVPAAPPHLETIRRRIGYVPRGGGLFPHLTVRDNATLVARSAGWRAGRRRDRLERLADLLRLPAAVLDSFPRETSERPRLLAALLRALFLDPDLLLIDEPFADLDPLLREEIVADVRRVVDETKKATVVASERLGDCARISDDIVVLRAGSTAQRGTLFDLVENPASLFVSEYVRSQRGVGHGLA